MKCLIWDDSPDQYINDFERWLAEYGIETTVTKSPTFDDFIPRLVESTWDFFIIDLVLEKQDLNETDQLVGHHLVRQIAQNDHHHDKPVFLLTSRFDTLDRVVAQLPFNVILKSKALQPSFLAPDMVRELARWGVVPRDKVFLIYGHDRYASEAREKLVSHLGKKRMSENRYLKVVEVTDVTAQDPFIGAIPREMNRCAAIIAICTPDDRVLENGQEVFRPRLNVLMEIGMAIGQKGSIRRLTLLKRCSTEDPSKNTSLPTNLNGVPFLDFFNNDISEIFPRLDARLKRMGFTFLPDESQR